MLFENINCCIIGAKALAYYGKKRYTQDTDYLFEYKDQKKVLKLLKSKGYKITVNHWSQMKATKDDELLDLLFTYDDFYSEVIRNRNKDGYADVNGLASCYVMSDKPQSYVDCIYLLRNYDIEFYEEAKIQYPEKIKKLKEDASKNIPDNLIQPYEEPLDFDMDEILKLINDDEDDDE